MTDFTCYADKLMAYLRTAEIPAISDMQRLAAAAIEGNLIGNQGHHEQ